MDLSQLRNEIDEIDDELVPLLLKRMDKHDFLFFFFLAT